MVSLISFGVWASRIRRVRAEVVALDARLGAHKGSSREALALAETKTTDEELKFLLRETEAGLIDLPTQHGVSQGPRSSYSFRSHADPLALVEISTEFSSGVSGKHIKTIFENCEIWRCEWNVSGTSLSSSGEDGVVRVYRADISGSFGLNGSFK